MSTKNLGRTPLEAGHNKGKPTKRMANQEAHATERARVRAAIGRTPDDFYVPAAKYGMIVDNSDKLGAVRRWIIKQCGRPWDKVFSDINQRFDQNTLAGRHIIGHIKDYIYFGHDHNDYQKNYADVYVDNSGILRKTKAKNVEPFYPPSVHEMATKERIKEWLNGRRLGNDGSKFTKKLGSGLLFWYEIYHQDKIVWCEDPKCIYLHKFANKKEAIDCPHFFGADQPYRYHTVRSPVAKRLNKLTKEEMAFWQSIPCESRPELDVYNEHIRVHK